MLPASNRGLGSCFAFPDQCLTPVPGGVPVEINYPNFGLNVTAAVFSPNVILTGMHALFLGTMLPVSNGDEPGVEEAPTNMGPCTIVMGNPKVLLNFLPAGTLTNPTMQNTVNANGLFVIPSLTNVFMTFAPARREPPDAAQPRDTIDGFARDLAAAEVTVERRGEAAEVRLSLFSGPAVARLEHELGRLRDAGARALVLDLRGNRGGDMKAALRLADRFLPRGASLGALVGPDGDIREFRARRDAHDTTPLILRVDGGTASAAELFSGTLQAHGRARLVGTRTCGKSTVQAVAGPPGAGEYATVATFRLAGGRELSARGLVPDEVVSATGSRPS